MRSHLPRGGIVAAFVFSLGLSACASSGGGTDGIRRNPNRIVRAELEQHETLSAYQAIERLRNRWFIGRGAGTPQPAVFVGGGRRMAGLDELRGLLASSVEQIEYLSAADATTRFGTGYDGGAIMVTMRRGRGG